MSTVSIQSKACTSSKPAFQIRSQPGLIEKADYFGFAWTVLLVADGLARNADNSEAILSSTSESRRYSSWKHLVTVNPGSTLRNSTKYPSLRSASALRIQ